MKYFPVTGKATFSNFHAGGTRAVDIFADEGQEVVAVVDGKAVYETFPDGGKTITLHGKDGREYYYAHLSKAVETKQVKAGERVGAVGATGNAAGKPAHCHFALSEKGGKIDEQGNGINPIDLLVEVAGQETEFVPADIIQKESGLSKAFATARKLTGLPKLWAETIPGVVTTFEPHQPNEVAITLDLCGLGPDGLDERIVDFLIKHKINATFFVSSRWIQAHEDKFKKLLAIEYFAIENHGARHLPASTCGRSIYGLRGPLTKGAFKREVEDNSQLIEQYTGSKPKLYRSGGAYYDEGAIAVLDELGMKAAGFSVLGDAGTTYTAAQTKRAISQAKSGDIIIVHANHPTRSSGAGVVKGLEYLVDSNFQFVLLKNRKLIEAA